MKKWSLHLILCTYIPLKSYTGFQMQNPWKLSFISVGFALSMLSTQQKRKRHSYFSKGRKMLSKTDFVLREGYGRKRCEASRAGVSLNPDLYMLQDQGRVTCTSFKHKSGRVVFSMNFVCKSQTNPLPPFRLRTDEFSKWLTNYSAQYQFYFFSLWVLFLYLEGKK